MDIHVDLVYSQTGYDVISYFRLALLEVRKTAANAATNGFWSNFSGAAFCLSHQLMDLLLIFVLH